MSVLKQLLLFCAFALLFFLYNPPAQADRLEQFQVERTQTVSVLTQGKALRVFILNPDAVEVDNILAAELTFKGLQIGSSLVHFWDQGGRRTIRVEVTQLASILKEFQEREAEARDRKLGVKDRTLQLRYRVIQEHREVGSSRLTLRDTVEDDRIRSHDFYAQMGIPIGLLKADLYLERRRDAQTKQEIIQPRNMVLALETDQVPFLGPVEFVAGDKDVHFSDFTLSGVRYRGLGLFPSGGRSFEGNKGRWDLHLAAGEQRQGSGLDSPAGQISRGARNEFVGGKLEYFLTDTVKVHLIGAHRHGKLDDDRSSHVYEAGLDWNFWNRWQIKGEYARNGTESAYQFDTVLEPLSGVRIQNQLFRVGKRYKSITGSIGQEGQSGLDSTVDVILPFWNEAIALSGGVSLLKDRNSINLNNADEVNSAYTLDASVDLPGEFSVRGGASYSDQSGSPLPSVTKRYALDLQKTIDVSHPLLQEVSIIAGFQKAQYQKSADVAGFDATLRQLRTVIRANFLNGFWGNFGWSLADLQEKQPEAGNEDTIHPVQMTAGGGWSRDFKAWTWPTQVNFSFRYEDAVDTFNRTHQPFSDRNQMSGNFGINIDMRKGRELFLNFTAARQTPQTGGGNPDVDIVLNMGIRADWNTGWVLPRWGRISGAMFSDLNANGQLDPGEAPQSGVRVYIVDGPSTKTNRNGEYSLRVREGEQKLKVDWGEVPKGHYFTTPNVRSLLMIPGKHEIVNFGIATEVEIRGRVFNDVDGDLQYTEYVDKPVSGVQFQTDSGGRSSSGPLGYYSIRRVLPGSGTVSLMPTSIPDGYRTLAAIRKKWTAKAGEVVVLDMPLKARRALWGFVFNDADRNGNFNPSFEEGVEGISVWLERSETGERSEGVTGKGGRYRFDDLDPGHYVLQIDAEDIPEGFSMGPVEFHEEDVPKEPYFRERLNFALIPPLTSEDIEKGVESVWEQINAFFVRNWVSRPDPGQSIEKRLELLWEWIGDRFSGAFSDQQYSFLPEPEEEK